MLYALPLIGYLIGSISSAILLSRLLGLPDPRESGSGNPGATNVLRVGGKWAAILTLVGDIAKGIIPVMAVQYIAGTDSDGLLALTGIATFLGHLYPVFFGFQGGKGVATAFGIFLAINPWVGCGLLAIWLLVALVSRYSSLSALLAAGAAPFVLIFTGYEITIVGAAAFISFMLIVRHKDNIKRLLAGQESKIGRH